MHCPSAAARFAWGAESLADGRRDLPAPDWLLVTIAISKNSYS